MQQVCDTQSVYTPQTGRVVIETHSKVSNVLLEDQTSLVSNEREKDTHVVEVAAVPSNYCPPCEQFKKFSQIVSTLAKQNESIRRDLRQKKSHKGQRLGKLGLADSAYERCETKNASGWICRNPTLVDRLPQTYIHRTSDYYFHRLVGTPFMVWHPLHFVVIFLIHWLEIGNRGALQVNGTFCAEFVPYDFLLVV